VVPLGAVRGKEQARFSSGIGELDRVLGGGLVRGCAVLVGGDPGIGKSTLLLQACASLGHQRKVLYATGEESVEQVALRAQRLGLGGAALDLLAEIELEQVQAAVASAKPDVLVVDSIQTLYSASLQAAPGTVSQVRECAAHLVRMAKQHGLCLFLVGHVTKEGALAGPRVLEHMVDTVLYFEGEPGSGFRALRALKNRFGSANELGVFAMGETGLQEVSNPSSMFLTAHERPVPGTCVFSAIEGNRPFLVEVQALAEDAPTPNPKRYASGVDTGRMQLLLAVLQRHCGVSALEQNIYAKVVGGVKVTEPAADLPVLLAAYSSLCGRPLPEGLVVFGEVGLAGELRAVADAQTRLREAAKLGFSRAILPLRCEIKAPVAGMQAYPASRVDEVLARIREL
jgi:DNA repair protein RadA/Sms